MNNNYTIKVGHPLLRPGLTIETEASEGYVVGVTEALMAMVRKINNPEPSATVPVQWYGTPEDVARVNAGKGDTVLSDPRSRDKPYGGPLHSAVRARESGWRSGRVM